jgi:Negative regulator of sigma E activity
MSDRLSEQISVFMDGELPQREAKLLIGRLATDPSLKARWERFHLIRETLRHNPPPVTASNFAGRVMVALAEEPAATEAGRSRHFSRATLKPLTGMALAATVSVLTVLMFYSLSPREDERGTVNPVAQTPSAPYKRVPGARWDVARPEVASRLDHYLLNHNEYLAVAGGQGFLPYVRTAAYESGR